MQSRIIRGLFVLLVPVLLHAQNAVKSPDRKAAIEFNSRYKTYKQLVERAKQKDRTVDYVELIAAYWDIYDKLPEAPSRDQMSQAFKDKNYKLAVQLAEGIYDNEFQNRGLHLAMANAYDQLGDKQKAELHRAWAEKLFNAILSSGDGKSQQTAYCVQGIREEYEIMKHFGYKVSFQAYMVGGYDSLGGIEEKTGRDVSLYFDISGNLSRCINSHRQKKN
jgi:hypothetical protein